MFHVFPNARAESPHSKLRMAAFNCPKAEGAVNGSEQADVHVFRIAAVLAVNNYQYNK